MALRTKYPVNSQGVQFGNMQELTAVNYLEVVPGETISGKVTAFVRSSPVGVAGVDTRAYLDAYAFYCPFRLLWDGWVDFITGRASTPVPRVGDYPQWNLEMRGTLPDTATGLTLTENTAFQRYMYNLVGNKFFLETDKQRSATETVPIEVLQRPSVLERKTLKEEDWDVPSPAIGSTVQELREALAADQWEQMRRYYGDRYVDYLAAVGVRTGWQMLEEPELIGQKHTDWKFQRTQQTASLTGPPAGTLGQVGGSFSSAVTCDLRRTFVPEHGLIGVYIVTRADPVFINPINGVAGPSSILWKENREDFWSPELENMRQKQLPSNYFLNYATVAAANGAPPWIFPQFEEYRSGVNYQGRTGTLAGLTFALESGKNDINDGPDFYKTHPSADYDGNFVAIGGVAGSHYQATIQNRIIRHSPVKRVGGRLKLS